MEKKSLQIIAAITTIIAVSASMIYLFNNVGAHTQNEDLEKQIVEIQTSNEQLELQIEELKLQNEDLEVQIAEIQASNSTLQLQGILANIDQLQIQIAEFGQEGDDLEGQIADILADIDQLQLQADQLQIQIAEFEQGNNGLEGQIADILADIDQLQLQISQLQLQISQLQLQIETLESRKIVTLTAEDGFQYELGTTGAILSTPSIPQYISAGSYTDSSPSGFLQEGYLTVALSYKQVVTSAAVFTQSIDYGTYEWKGKVAGIEDGRFMGWGFHKFYRQSSDGIEVYLDPYYDKWFLWNARAGASTATEIVGVDFTIEHKFTIQWTTSYLKLYIDDTLVAQNTENIPNIRLYPFQEIINLQEGTQDAYVFSKDWQKTA